jgi:hypothetical protein
MTLILPRTDLAKDFITGGVPSVDLFTVTVTSAVSVPKVLTADSL